MTVILLVLMVSAVLALEYFLHLRKKSEPSKQQIAKLTIIAKVEGISMPQGISYHPLHTWVREIDAQTVVVGLDDFARRLIGRIDKATLPMTNVELDVGQGATYLRSGRRMVPIANPVEGEIVEVNELLHDDPDLVQLDPYGKGWLYKVRSWRLAEQLSGLLGGSVARQWMELSMRRLRSAFGGELAVMAQDGGELMDDIGSGLAPERWVRLIRDHLGTESVECE
ncbi:MAG TPA: glycine cleavage system protein H [Acidobacteriota bacterium]|nr:glycine cleavage system protein H [Acidobacteriota bacterium]